MDNVFLKFYQNPKTLSSISLSVNKDGKFEFNGIINDNIVISPIPHNFRKRRDLLRRNFSFFENDAEDFINSDEHIIYKQTFNNASQHSISKIFDDKMEIKSVFRRSITEIPNIVYPEIMVFIDDVLFKKFNFDVVKAVEYTLGFWNGVDLRYREFEKPKVRLYVAGIVLAQEPLPFVNKAIDLLPKGEIYSDLLINGFTRFLHEEKFIQPIKDYDISMFITGRDMLDSTTRNKNLTGYAYRAGVCRSDITNKYTSSGIIEDSNGYDGILAAAHELAHILGAPHDEEDSKNFAYNTKHCLKNESHIMSSYRYSNNENKILFSSCSKKIIGIVLSLDFAKCIRNNPAEYKNNKPLSRILPGQIMSLDEQCKNLGYIRCKDERTTCLDLYCVEKENMTHTISVSSYTPPAEGSSCADEKHCLSGDCVDIINSLL
ncbi:venom metalloproteinase antarease TserMP_A-like [Leptopilina boulardi]|uniref:venom metalloproteinase antarease TserMP_A-like n=1 Tax=Leptopilina boulardi TaxID=63433 RepID=UPI0021F54EFF|nr:venom metalloproteinase antarease TserMP_A-like [Leptopilina boulardi]